TTQLADWRSFPPGLGQFDAVIASDVLYELSYGELVAEVIASTLSEDGTAFVADPGRSARDSFLTTVARRRLEVVGRQEFSWVDGDVRQRITIYHIRRR